MEGLNGSAWTGWAVMGGVPTTILAFGISPLAGLVMGAATIIAFRHGMKLEAFEDSLRKKRDDAYRSQAIEARALADQLIAAENAAIDESDRQYDLIWQEYEDGLIDSEERDTALLAVDQQVSR